MSRIGKNPVMIPASVTVTENGRSFDFKGPKGEISVHLSPKAKVTHEDDKLVIAPKDNSRAAHQQQGLVRTLLQNGVTGVTDGFSKRVEIQGVGYRMAVAGNKLTLNVGFSHPVEYQLPEGISAAMEENVLVVSGIDRQLVGQAAAEIRAVKKPEPYKGKGLRYQGEWIRRKVGKAASK